MRERGQIFTRSSCSYSSVEVCTHGSSNDNDSSRQFRTFWEELIAVLNRAIILHKRQMDSKINTPVAHMVDENINVERFKGFGIRIYDTDIQYSTMSTPGGGGHSTYMYGSVAIEQFMASLCKNMVLTKLRECVIPTTRQAYRVTLQNLLAYVSDLAYSPSQNVKTGNGEAVPSSTTMYFTGNMAFEAMRQKILTVIQGEIFLFEFE